MEENDVNTENPVVTDSGVVEAVAPTQDVSQVVAGDGEQPKGDVTPDAAAAPAGQPAEPGPVPYDRFKEVNEANKTLESENQQLRDHMNLLGNQQPQPTQPGQQAQQPDSLTLQVMKQMGMDPDGFASNAEMAQVYDAVSQIVARQNASQNSAQSFVASNPDYAEVVGTTDAAGRFTAAPPLLRAMQKDPQLAADLQAAGAAAGRLAYKIAVNDPAYQQALADKNKADPVVAGEAAAKALAAASSLTSVSATGTAGTVDKGAQFAAMSDEQIQAHLAGVLKAGGVAH